MVLYKRSDMMYTDLIEAFIKVHKYKHHCICCRAVARGLPRARGCFFYCLFAKILFFSIRLQFLLAQKSHSHEQKKIKYCLINRQ